MTQWHFSSMLEIFQGCLRVFLENIPILFSLVSMVTDAYEKAHFILDTVDEILFIRVFI